MFSSEVKAEALGIYSSCRSIKETVRRMGYIFSRQSLYVWIKSDGKPPQKRKPKNLINTSTHPAIPTAEFKLKIIKRCFEDGEMVKTVAKEIGYSRQTICYWRIEYIKKGIARLMRERKAIPRGKLKTPNSATTVQNKLALKR